MRGYGMHAVNDVGWIEKDKPECGPLDAIVRPTVVAPCSSDTHVSHGGSGPHSELILGHEAVGLVEEVGALVETIKPGDLVAVPCVTPDWLVGGVQNHKTFSHDVGPFGSFKLVGSKDGVMAEFCHVNQADANLALIPAGVSPEAALMTVDMASTGFYGAEMADIVLGDTVVVIGIGPVGLMALVGAILRGAARVIAVGARPQTVAVARQYGASQVISYKDGPIDAQVLELTGGVDKVILAGGGPEAFLQGLNMLKAGGTLANVNFFDAADTLTFPALSWGLGMADKDIRGGFCPGGKVRIERLLALIEYGRFDPSAIISHRFQGFDALPEAFELMDRKAPDLIKPIVHLA
ncbi:MAG: zinc-binding dehydrogenase [Propionibacteriaceae bacterium]|nr:zinc-binding dehydrogenase [Propionibacteriaceae bacterium]